METNKHLYTNTNQKEHQIFRTIQARFTMADGSLHYSGRLLERAAKRFGNDTALIGSAFTLTYKELYAHAVYMSNVLKKRGAKRGDRVLLLRENSLHFYVSYFAIWQIGAIAVPVNALLHSKELACIIDDAQPVVIITSPELQDKIAQIQEHTSLESLPSVIVDDVINFATPYQRLKEAADVFEVASVDQDDLCLLLYTSGTTGKPKGVMLSSRNVMTNAMQCFARISLTLDLKKR